MPEVVPEFSWIAKYSVGVKEIDEQHQHFLQTANDIIALSGKDVSTEDIMADLGELNNYAIYHFATEENLFKNYGYRDAEEHINAHEDFREKIDDFMARAGGASADTRKLAIEIAEFAGSWLINHIMDVDQKYSGFMNEHGIK